MKHHITGILALALSAASLTWTTAAAAQIGGPVIDTDSAILAGSGCDSSNSFISTLMDMHGNYVMVLNFYDLAAQISNPVMAQRKSCVLRAKTLIPAGRSLRIVSVTAYGESSHWGRVRGSAAISTTLHGTSLGILTQDINGRFDHDFVILNSFLPGQATVRASNRTQQGFFGVNAATSIQAISRDGEGVVALSSIEIKYRVD